MNKALKLITISVFSVFIAGFFLLNLFTPTREFSEQENRYLQTCPKFSLTDLFSGKFAADFEQYTSDQFAWRNRWISTKARLELLSGKKENNDVFLCEGEKLLIPMKAPDSALVQKNIDSINKFSENINIPVSLSLIPSSSDIYSYLLPEGVADQVDVPKLLADIYEAVSIPTVNLLAPLQKYSSEYIYYRTDHHWTTLGAYYGYVALSQSLGYSPLSMNVYSPTTVSDSFYGTSASSSGFSWVSPDSIQKFVDKNPGVVRYDGSQGVPGRLYDDTKLATKDKYSYFLGGNCARTVISTGNASLPKLLLVRDSFADSLTPFLLEHFSEIHLIDLRYFHSSVSDYVESEGIDSCLIIYSIDNFCSDPGIQLLEQ